MKYSVKPLAEDSRVFKVDPQIKVKSVRFQNRYGFMVAGNLYLPADFDESKKYAVIVISGPFGAVNEQSSGLYAQTLAQRGFVTAAFDQPTTGESSGDVRNVASRTSPLPSISWARRSMLTVKRLGPSGFADWAPMS